MHGLILNNDRSDQNIEQESKATETLNVAPATKSEAINSLLLINRNGGTRLAEHEAFYYGT